MAGSELALRRKELAPKDELRWAGRAGWRRPASVLRLPQDVLLEIACLLDVWALLSLRQVCRVLCSLSHEPVIFLRLLARGRIPPVAPRLILPSLCPSPEERVLRACRLHRNWDLAAFPITVRTSRSTALVRHTNPTPPRTVSAPSTPVSDDVNPIVSLPYHLPPGAEAYPFLKLETYAPFRDSVAKSKSSFGPGQTAEPVVRAVPIGLPRVPSAEQSGGKTETGSASQPAPSNSVPTPSTPSTAPSQPSTSRSTVQPPPKAEPSVPRTQPAASSSRRAPSAHSTLAPEPQPLSHFGNFVATTVRRWSAQPTPNTTYSDLVLSLLSYPDAPPALPSASDPAYASASASSPATTPLQAQPVQTVPAIPPRPLTGLVTSPSRSPHSYLRSSPTPPPAPAPRPTKVSSISVRAVFVRLVGGGRWGVFVVKRQRVNHKSNPSPLIVTSGLGLSLDKGKGKAVESEQQGQALTAEALTNFSHGRDKGKGKERVRAGADGRDVARWVEDAKVIAVPGRIGDGVGVSARESNFGSASGTGRDKIGIGTGKLGGEKEREKEKGVKGDGETFLVVYDLDAVGGAVGGADKGVVLPERGQMAEYALKWTPTAMSCRGTKEGVVIVLVRGTGEGTSHTTMLRWSYLSPNVTHLSTHKSACLLGAICIQEYPQLPSSGQEGEALVKNKGQPSAQNKGESSAQSKGESLAKDKDEAPAQNKDELPAQKHDRTLVAIVHRPRTVMIQDIDSGKRCFVKLSSVPPTQHRHTLQAVHLIPGPRLLVLRMVQGDEPSYALEEYDVPAMGESVSPTVPLQRQWIRDVELHSCTIIEGPTYDGGPPPDLALWAFSTSPQRSVMHWLLRSGSGASSSVVPTPIPASPSDDSVALDIYALPGDSTYPLPAQKVSTNKLSFPHHKATIAPGARRAMWFERPERSRAGEARGMRGVWGYTSIGKSDSEEREKESKGDAKEEGADAKEEVADAKEEGGEEKEEGIKSVVRSCTSELPDDVLGAMESNTLAVAFDEASGRAVVVTCGEAFGGVSGSRVWVLDYA